MVELKMKNFHVRPLQLNDRVYPQLYGLLYYYELYCIIKFYFRNGIEHIGSSYIIHILFDHQ